MSDDDAVLLARIRAGDEAAFDTLVRRHTPGLLRLARARSTGPLSEEIVQEAWVQVLGALDRFEGRSSVKTWLCGIVVNVARARGRKEQRSVPMSCLSQEDERAVDPDRFRPEGDVWAGHWLHAPAAWPDTPERGALTAELRAALNATIDALPPPQREVLVLRDVEGLSGEEVCNVLALSDTHVRVLLHRARCKVRTALETHFGEVLS